MASITVPYFIATSKPKNSVMSSFKRRKKKKEKKTVLGASCTLISKERKREENF